jgi:hypothetical protein
LTDKRLGGVLAARQNVCRPDEVIRLHVACNINRIRYDIGGMSWEGRTGAGRAAESGENAALWVDNLMSEEDASGRSLPSAIVFGANPACVMGQAILPLRDLARNGMWLLTSERLCWVEEVSPAAAADATAEDGSMWARARKIGAGVRDFSRDVVDVLQDKLPYTPHEPIPLADLVVRVEFSVQHIASVSPAHRRLPSEYQTGVGSLGSPVLRVTLHDGSGVDFYIGNDTLVQRVHAMALGQR